ncbi:hypothetical protein HY251_06765 [bacterium]|nr:hypothetical protein [bacterium]
MRAQREATAAARARHDALEARLERDRLKLELLELRPVRARHEELMEALSQDAGAPVDAVVRALARRSEVVLVHEPPDFQEVASRLERARARGRRRRGRDRPPARSLEGCARALRRARLSPARWERQRERGRRAHGDPLGARRGLALARCRRCVELRERHARARFLRFSIGKAGISP